MDNIFNERDHKDKTNRGKVLMFIVMPIPIFQLTMGYLWTVVGPFY